MLTTRAALFHGVGEPVTVEEITLDEPRPHEVVVRMAAVGICGTDLHQVKGEFRRPTPMALGHEGAGIVESVGEAVTAVAPGDDVVLSWAAGCRECPDCLRGRPAACTRLHAALAAGTLVDGTTGMSWRGAPVYRATATGCLAERVVVHESVALPLHGAVALHEAALLGCAALTGIGAALFAARVRSGDTCLVIGAGGVGAFVAQGARIAGAGSVIVVDPVGERRALSLEVGATHTAAPEEAEEAVRSVAPDGVDVAFDAVGTAGTAVAALDLTRAGGTTMLVGLPPAGTRLDLDPAHFLRREKWLSGTMYGSEDPAVALPVLLDHLRAGRLRLAPLVGPTYPLAAADEAVRAALAGSAGRVLVDPGATA